MSGMVQKPGLKTGAAALALIAALLVLLSGCGRAIISEEFYQSYQVRPGTVLEIYNPNGPVTVTASENDQVEIAAVKETFRGQSALDAVDIYIDIAHRMVVETVHPAESRDVTVKYEIRIPEDVLLAVIGCSNGNITVEGVNGNPVLSTSNGNIAVTGVGGIVSARSSNGNLNVSAVEGLARLRTSNGNIEADLASVDESLEIVTSNGSINLFITPGLALDIEAGTSNGEIKISSLRIETTLLEQTALIGTMNGGGPRVTLSTSNGSIELAQLR